MAMTFDQMEKELKKQKEVFAKHVAANQSERKALLNYIKKIMKEMGKLSKRMKTLGLEFQMQNYKLESENRAFRKSIKPNEV